MDENKDADSKETGEYEDDFEKDLEWLINEKEPSDVNILEMACGNGESISKEVKEKETEAQHTGQLSAPGPPSREEVSRRRKAYISVPSSQSSESVSDSDSENSSQESKLESPRDEDEDEDEEVRRYIMEKITQANKILQSQEPVNDKRERKLKFKDKLVDLEVPPLEEPEDDQPGLEGEGAVSGKLSQLRISSGLGPEAAVLPLPGGGGEEHRDRKILVERDGKFELLNLQDIESQGFLPALAAAPGPEGEAPPPPPPPPGASSSGARREEPAARAPGSAPEEPRPPAPPSPPDPRARPSSAANSELSKGPGRPGHRVQSASVPPVTSTYCLSPRQKELQKRLEQRREKLKREEEQRKIEEEKEKRKENEIVFKAWLQKKREQVVEMRRVQRAKEIEDMSSRQENRDPQQAFRLWLKKKHEEQMKERKTEELRKQEECLFFLQGTEGRERAFKQWLRRKRVEKLVEQQAVKERTRQFRLEAKRSRQLQNQSYMSEAKSFRFTDHYN